MKQPAIELGLWVKVRRQRLGTVARVFAGQIELSPAKYAEFEAGVVRWIGAKQEALIPRVLGLSDAERRQFLTLLGSAREAPALEFSDVFTRAQLEPVRLRSSKRKQLSVAAKDEILNSVFTPLK